MASTVAWWPGSMPVWPQLEQDRPVLTTVADLTLVGLACRLADGVQPAVMLDISPRSIAQRHWPHGQPGPLQLERAIDDVENAIEQAGLAHGSRHLLQVHTPLSSLLRPALATAGDHRREDVEDAFSRLVAGSGSATDQPGADGEHAAALLLVRELMHHLGFQTLALLG